MGGAWLPDGRETNVQLYWIVPSETEPQEFPVGSAAWGVSITRAPTWIAEVTPSGSRTTEEVTGVPDHASGEVTQRATVMFWKAVGEASPNGFFTARLTV